jgi:hypothetical protein
MASLVRSSFICVRESGLANGKWNGHLLAEMGEPCSCCNHTSRPPKPLSLDGSALLRRPRVQDDSGGVGLGRAALADSGARLTMAHLSARNPAGV